MKRSAFAPSPLPAELPARVPHPGPVLLGFVLLSLALALAGPPAQLLPAGVALAALLLLPRPRVDALRVLLGFLPLLVLLPLLRALDWRGFGDGPWPWRLAAAGWSQGLQLALRLALWILISALTLTRLHPAALLARLPASPRLARLWLAPLLALSWLSLTLREAWLLERAWRARGGRRGWRAAHWPSLLLPLFRNLLARGDALADSLTLRRFPDRWAGRARPRPRPVEFLPALLAAAALLGLLWMQRGSA